MKSILKLRVMGIAVLVYIGAIVHRAANTYMYRTGLMLYAYDPTATPVAAVVDLIKQQGTEWNQFKTAQTSRLDNLERETRELTKRAGRPFAGASDFDSQTSLAATHETWIDVKTKKAVPVLRHNQSLVALRKTSGGQPSLGRVLRGIVLGGTAHDAHELEAERKSLNMFSDTNGGYTVSGSLSDMWIDNLRAQMVLSQAGAVTMPMDTGEVTIARVIADPTVSWKAESAAITESGPTFSALKLSARTCVCLVKLSLELSQDSANIEQILQQTITSAMAAAIDNAGMNGSTTDAAAAPGGLFNASGINSISAVGAPTSWNFVLDGIYELLAANVPLASIGALIAHPKVWLKMSKLKTGIASDLTTLVQPPDVAAVPKLYTTAAPYTGGTTCSAIIGNWRDLVFGVRNDIQVRVLNEAYMGSNLQVALLCFARVDFQPTRAASFTVMPGITV